MTLDFRHILEDKTAAYKPCAYTGEGGHQVTNLGFSSIHINVNVTKQGDQMSTSSTKNLSWGRILSGAQ